MVLASGTPPSKSSAMRLMRLLSSSEVPGAETTKAVMLPSLNSGKNSRPSVGKVASAARKRAPAAR